MTISYDRNLHIRLVACALNDSAKCTMPPKNIQKSQEENPRQKNLLNPETPATKARNPNSPFFVNISQRFNSNSNTARLCVRRESNGRIQE